MLARLDPAMPVVVSGATDGYDSLVAGCVLVRDILPDMTNGERWYEGDHWEAVPSDPNAVRALVLARTIWACTGVAGSATTPRTTASVSCCPSGTDEAPPGRLRRSCDGRAELVFTTTPRWRWLESRHWSPPD